MNKEEKEHRIKGIVKVFLSLDPISKAKVIKALGIGEQFDQLSSTEKDRKIFEFVKEQDLLDEMWNNFKNLNKMKIQIGDRVKKKSDKPFKSTFKINTVTGFGIHPVTGKEVLYFSEDISYVETQMCEKI